MDNCKSLISKHNFRTLSSSKPSTTTTSPSTPLPATTTTNSCNCRRSNDCPLQNQCLVTNLVYSAKVETNNGQSKEYIGMTANTFKERLNNHTKSFKNAKYRHNTELSKHIWDLKDKQLEYTINWSILKRAASYSSGSKKCNLCLQEKLCILNANKSTLLNKRCELFSKCRHQRRFLAGRFERAQAKKSRKHTRTITDR